MNMPMNMPIGSSGGGMPVMPTGMPMGMNSQNPIAKIQEHVLNAKSILIVTHESPTFDSIAATCSMYLGCMSLGKQVTMACPDEMKVEMSNFIGVNKIVNSIAQRNFIVSMDYVEGSIEKVSYNIAENKFNLVIETRDGYEPFSADKVSYSSSGASADCICVIDTIHLGGLKQLYESEKELFAGKTIVNIDHHPNNTQFGSVNFVNPMASSTSELVAEILSGIGVKLTVDIATNLLNGIYGATENFSLSKVSPRAFEVAAVCTRAGGKRFMVSQPDVQHIQQKEAVFQMHESNTQHSVPTSLPVSNTQSMSQIQEQVTKKQDFHPKFPRDNVQQNLSGRKNISMQTIRQEQKKHEDQAPDDWLKPKIFKSKDVN